MRFTNITTDVLDYLENQHRRSWFKNFDPSTTPEPDFKADAIDELNAMDNIGLLSLLESIAALQGE